jgi:hypothetical protein
MWQWVNRARRVLTAGLLPALMTAAALAAWADTGNGVRAHVDRTVLPPGESLQLTVTIRNAEGEVDIAGLSDFRVFPQGTRASFQVRNNVTSREEAHTYLLIPMREGRLTIPALTVRTDGRSLQTEPIAIQVTHQTPSGGDSGPKEVWVESTLSESRPFAGQQVAYTFSLYQAVRVTNAAFQPPDFSGFIATEIRERSSEKRVIDGLEYVVTHIHYLLVPLEAGPREIEPGILQLGIVRPDKQRRRLSFDDFFSDPLLNRGRVEAKVLQSTPLSLQVRPLPNYPGPEPFSGLIGRFDMAAAINETELAVGDATTLAVTLHGSGNIMDARIALPALPENVKSYADAPEEDVQLTPEGYSGTKLVRTALVPIAEGEIHLPAVRLTYFDVALERYRTLSATLPALKVHPAAGPLETPLSQAAEPGATRQQKVAFTGRDILPLKEDLSALNSPRSIEWPLFALGLFLPAMAFGLLCLVEHLRRKDATARARMGSKARRALKAARAARTERESFLSALYQSLSAAIFAYGNRTGEALTWKEAEALLCDQGLDRATAREAADLLEAIESRKFSGSHLPAEMAGELFERTRRMVRRLAP